MLIMVQNMLLKAGFLFTALLVGSYAFPVEDDMSIFFDFTDPSARVFGGTPAGHVPYMVALTTGVSVRKLACGGSLVTTKHVMTAAHCVFGLLSNGNLLGSLRGTVDTNRFASGGTSYVFASYSYHPDYDSRVVKNDIGFLVTSTNVKLSNRVSLIPLSLDFVGAGVPTISFGWGFTYTSLTSDVLLQLTGTVVEGSECVTWVGQRAEEVNMRHLPHVDPRVEICSFNSNDRGMCNGDSGGPLVRTDRNQQIGLVSWGVPCGKNAPDVFARVSAFRSYIESTLR